MSEIFMLRLDGATREVLTKLEDRPRKRASFLRDLIWQEARRAHRRGVIKIEVARPMAART